MPTRPQSSDRPLSLKERTFVDRYLALGGERGAGTKAAQLAGYSASWSAIAAHRMLRRPRVMRAIEEESKRLVRALGPQAIKVIKEILDDREHKDRLKAARTLDNGAANGNGKAPESPPMIEGKVVATEADDDPDEE